MNITKAVTDNDFRWVEAAAEEIWHEWFPQMITDEQIDYMLEKFLSFDAIKRLADEGCEFYIFTVGDKRVGFTEIKPEDGTLFLSKLYLFKEERGKGYADEAFKFIFDYAAENGLKSVWLTVNKQNHRAIACYKKQKMEIIRSQTADIGGGFVMDDYVFSKDVKSE